MDDKVLLAVVAAASALVGGIVSSLLGPLLKHKLEQASETTKRRRDQVERWRKMIVDVANAEGGSDRERLLAHPEYMSLEPHMLPDTARRIRSSERIVVVGSVLPMRLAEAQKEVARIERQWNLLE